MRRAFALAPLLALALALAGGCAAHRAPPPPPGARASLAMMPLENLSGRAEYGDRYTRLVWTAIGGSGRFDLVDPGEVDAMLVEQRIRTSAMLTREQVLKAAARLHVHWLLAGTLLECGTVHTPDGDIPSFSLALRLIDGRTGLVVWTDLRARSGEDRETIFGWGREEDLQRLAETTARELVAAMPIPSTPDSLQTTEGKP